MDVWSFGSEIKSCFAFYILLYCNRNHHTAFEIDRTIQQAQNEESNIAKNRNVYKGHTYFLIMILELLHFLKGTKGKV